MTKLQFFTPKKQGEFEATALAGVYVFEPKIHGDERGFFAEWYRSDAFGNAVGYPFVPEQANVSQSAAGVARGLHFADVPPGQAKLVFCPAGEVVDVLVDLRRGSETFGQHVAVQLNSKNLRAVYIPAGVAHGFVAQKDDSVLTYLTTLQYTPEIEREISWFDPQLLAAGLDVRALAPEGTELVLSAKDQAAPTIAEFEDNGNSLPSYDEYVTLDTAFRDGWALANEEAATPEV